MSKNVRVGNLAGAMRPNPGAAMGNITIGAAAVTLSAELALPLTTRQVFISLDGGSARLTLDGSTPVASTTGHLLPEGMSDVWSARVFKDATMVREGGSDAVLRVSQMTL